MQKITIMRKWGEGQEGRLLQHSKINKDYIDSRRLKMKNYTIISIYIEKIIDK